MADPPADDTTVWIAAGVVAAGDPRITCADGASFRPAREGEVLDNAVFVNFSDPGGNEWTCSGSAAAAVPDGGCTEPAVRGSGCCGADDRSGWDGGAGRRWT